jgi:hypothetical protein
MSETPVRLSKVLGETPLPDRIRKTDFGSQGTRRQTTQLEKYVRDRLVAHGVSTDTVAEVVCAIPAKIFDDAKPTTTPDEAIADLSRFVFGSGPGTADERNEFLDEAIGAAALKGSRANPIEVESAKSESEERTRKYIDVDARDRQEQDRYFGTNVLEEERARGRHSARAAAKDDEPVTMREMMRMLAGALASKNASPPRPPSREERPDFAKGLATDRVLFSPALWHKARAMALDVRLALQGRVLIQIHAGWERNLADSMLEILLAWYVKTGGVTKDETDEDETDSTENETDDDDTIPRHALDWILRLWALSSGVPAARVNELAAGFKGRCRYERYLPMLAAGAAGTPPAPKRTKDQQHDQAAKPSNDGPYVPRALYDTFSAEQKKMMSDAKEAAKKKRK